MRPLTEEETEIFFKKLTNYIGKNIIHLLDRQDEEYCFRLHKDRVYYLSLKTLNNAISVSHKNLITMGTLFGKFTKSKKFTLLITSLDYLAQYSIYKVWLKTNGEMPFLYGNNIVKAHVLKITDDTPKHQAVVIFNNQDIPLGFGVTGKSSLEWQKADPTAIVVFHQADIGEYLREEETLI